MQLVDQQKKTTVKNSYKERRKFTRFVPQSGTMAVNNHALGPIIDISMGGLSFRYIDDRLGGSMTDLFGIFLGSEDILIDKIQSQVIVDKIIPADNTSFIHNKSRQCSIQFTSLTRDQRTKLEDFILTKTQGVS